MSAIASVHKRMPIDSEAHCLRPQGACEGSLACSTCHVIVESPEFYARLKVRLHVLPLRPTAWHRASPDAPLLMRLHACRAGAERR